MFHKKKRPDYILAKKLIMILIIITGSAIITACSKNENEEILTKVLEQVYTCPDAKLIELSDDMLKIYESKIIEGTTGVYPLEKTEFFDRIDELYQPYFTEKAYQNLLNERVPYRYHLDAKENNYTLKVNSIDINKNKTDKSKLDFIAHIEYTPETGKKKTVDLQGTAQFSEDGKINYIKTFGDLEKKLSE